MKYKLESRLPGEISVTSDEAILMAEIEELKSLLMKVKEESEKVGLKLNIKKIKIMASGPITSWQIDGETMETGTDFIFLGSKITAGDDYSLEMKRCLLLGRKVMTNLDSILKIKDTTFPTKVCLVKAVVFPVIMYGCESWTVKKAEHGAGERRGGCTFKGREHRAWVGCWKDRGSKSLGVVGGKPCPGALPFRWHSCTTATNTCLQRPHCRHASASELGNRWATARTESSKVNMDIHA